jgi:ATP-dependent NAD(P)H-hydrate dehydratase
MGLAEEIQRDMQRLSHLKQHVIPKLTGNLHKGACGRVGVIGGSLMYTGAPYFAGISALRTGADIAYIQTHSQAAHVIKGYSPELIVLSGLENYFETRDPEFSRQLTRMHSLVVGPGLSRDDHLLQSALELVKEAQVQKLALVLDAEGLLLVQRHPELFQNYPMTVLTPNKREFHALCQAFVSLFLGSLPI